MHMQEARDVADLCWGLLRAACKVKDGAAGLGRTARPPMGSRAAKTGSCSGPLLGAGQAPKILHLCCWALPLERDTSQMKQRLFGVRQLSRFRLKCYRTRYEIMKLTQAGTHAHQSTNQCG